jgi:hypothetical protein
MARRRRPASGFSILLTGQPVIGPFPGRPTLTPSSHSFSLDASCRRDARRIGSVMRPRRRLSPPAWPREPRHTRSPRRVHLSNRPCPTIRPDRSPACPVAAASRRSDPTLRRSAGHQPWCGTAESTRPASRNSAATRATPCSMRARARRLVRQPPAERGAVTGQRRPDDGRPRVQPRGNRESHDPGDASAASANNIAESHERGNATGEKRAAH